MKIMKGYAIFLFKALLINLFLLSALAVYGETSFTITPNTAVMGPFVDFQDLGDTQSKFESIPNLFFSKNSEVLPTGMALSNTIGYPNGKSIIKPFPHFEFGAAAGGSVYRLSRKDDFTKDDLEDNPVIPGGGVNASIHAGTGIAKNIDITFKFFVLDMFYSKTKSFDKTDGDSYYMAEISDTNAISLGCKVRYNLLKKKKNAPMLFSLGGATLNLGFDYMYNIVKTQLRYDKTVTGITFDVRDPFDPGNSTTQTTDLTGSVTGTAEVNTSIFSITPEIFVYADILYLFSFYTGPSVSVNFGNMNINVLSSGTLTNSSALSVNTSSTGTLELVGANEELAAAQFTSTNRMEPKRFIPKWTLGLELNLWVLKLQAEVTAILTGAYKDSVIAQAGVRFDF